MTATKNIPDLNRWLETIKQELLRASVDKKHPFRFVVLSTSSENVSSRYVVLRRAEGLERLLIYTDARSKKADEISSNNNIQLLFFNQKSGLQVQISCKATLHHRNNTSRKEWQNVQGEARKAYCTVLSPGEEIGDLEDGYKWDETYPDHNFMVIEAEPYKIEFLKLGRDHHQRGFFKKKESLWQGKWLVT